MAKSRVINTNFWDDNYTSNLDPIEKLLFLYALTNTSTNICGIYEIPLKKIANETGIDKDMVIKILGRFSRDEKIFFFDGWLACKNFIKNQNQGSPKVKLGIENELKKVPQNILETLISYGMDTLSYLIKSNLIKSNLIQAPKKGDEDGKLSQLGAEVLKLFEEVDPKNKTYYSNKTQRKACDFLIKEYSFEVVKSVIAVLPQTNQLPYFPSVTTPHELKEKWVKLKDMIVKKKSEVITKGRGIANFT